MLFHFKNSRIRFSLMAFVIALLIIHAQPVMAATAGGVALNLGVLGQALADVTSFLRGPMMKFVVTFVMMVSAFQYFNGKDMAEGTRVFATIAITVGFYWGASTFIPGLGAIL